MVALNIPVICVKSARYLDTTAEQATNIIMLYVSLYMHGDSIRIFYHVVASGIPLLCMSSRAHDKILSSISDHLGVYRRKY